MSASPPSSSSPPSDHRPPIDRKAVLAILLEAAREAGEGIMRVYAEPDCGVEYKGPNDPVTRADREANALLLTRLHAALPGIPIVAEESDPSTFSGFGEASVVLFVDPVDGTRDFIGKSGDFAVMLGLAEDGKATVGVVHCPALKKTYTGIVGEGAFVIDEHGASSPIAIGTATAFDGARCAVSRFHRTLAVDAKLAQLGSMDLVPMGSAGVKAVNVASSAIDLYAHPSGSAVKLWDACAPEAIVHAAGGIFTDATGRPFDYRGPVAQGHGTVAANAVLHRLAIERLNATMKEEPSA